MELNPIWKDYYVTLGTAEVIVYRITTGGNAIYTGKAYKRPGETSNRVRINDVCADYLSTPMPSSFVDFAETSGVGKEFAVQVQSGSSWTTREYVYFYNNWSHDYNKRVNSSGWLSEPICDIVDRRMPVLLSHASKDGDGDSVYLIDDGGSVVTAEESSSNATLCILPWANEGASRISERYYGGGAFDLRIEETCNRYALYYLNAYGGFDQLLIRGAYKESNEVTRHTYKRMGNNANVQERETFNHVNEVKRVITLNTGWLTDKQSLRMHHLLNSTDVYLYDMTYGTMTPVVLESTYMEFRTFKESGRTAINYAIDVTIAKDNVRR